MGMIAVYNEVLICSSMNDNNKFYVLRQGAQHDSSFEIFNKKIKTKEYLSEYEKEFIKKMFGIK